MQEKISKGGWGVSEVSCRPAAPTGGDSKNQTPAAFRFGFVKDSQMITVVSNSTGGGGGGFGNEREQDDDPPQSSSSPASPVVGSPPSFHVVTVKVWLANSMEILGGETRRG